MFIRVHTIEFSKRLLQAWLFGVTPIGWHEESEDDTCVSIFREFVAETLNVVGGDHQFGEEV